MKSKQQRRQEHAERMEERKQRTAGVQLLLLQRRPGLASRERKRLVRQIEVEG